MKAKNCECCMMPLAKDPKESGSEKYCSNCYVNGKLLAEGMTLGEFQKKAYAGMVDGGHNKPMAWFLSKMIGFAPYWKNK
ncbi:MAG: zinc ribbon domain-containing protein [Deltaproteobacteria bacterium]|nr:zinc ribbon domain-containing protein [Deltaproteobacteria bacterium]